MLYSHLSLGLSFGLIPTSVTPSQPSPHYMTKPSKCVPSTMCRILLSLMSSFLFLSHQRMSVDQYKKMQSDNNIGKIQPLK